MEEAVSSSVANILAQDRDAKAQLKKELNKLEAQEERLIELAATRGAAHEQDSYTHREDRAATRCGRGAA